MPRAKATGNTTHSTAVERRTPIAQPQINSVERHAETRCLRARPTRDRDRLAERLVSVTVQAVPAPVAGVKVTWAGTAARQPALVTLGTVEAAEIESEIRASLAIPDPGATHSVAEAATALRLAPVAHVERPVWADQGVAGAWVVAADGGVNEILARTQ